jgi:hypothetical protein
MEKPLSPSEWVREKIEQLRQSASIDSKMPASLRQHLELSSTSSDEIEKSPRQLAKEAVNGIDIEKAYPNAYRQILTNQHQQESFLFYVSQFEKAIQTTSEPIMLQNENKWSVCWHSSPSLLQKIFAIPTHQPTYRRSESWLTNKTTTLYKGRMQVGDSQIALLLEGKYANDKPNELQLSIAAAANPPLVSPDTPLVAHVSWGVYDHEVTISGRQSVDFPPIPLNVMFNDEAQEFIAGLHFMLEPKEI